MIYACPNGHISSVARYPNAEGVRRCYFCPKVTEPLLTAKYIERATTALFPFVQAWNLPLNPENLDLMAYCVLEHLETDDLEQIVAEVEKAIQEDARQQKQMEEAWRRASDQDV